MDLNKPIDGKNIVAAIDHMGSDHSMRRDRPYVGQPWTTSGTRGSAEIKGITFRDLRDCFIRAYIQSHITFQENSTEPLEPNSTLYHEAAKGENAAVSANDMYSLVGTIDPMAFSQNLGCEIEKMMGIFPNYNENECKPVIESVLGFEISGAVFQNDAIDASTVVKNIMDNSKK